MRDAPKSSTLVADENAANDSRAPRPKLSTRRATGFMAMGGGGTPTDDAARHAVRADRLDDTAGCREPAWLTKHAWEKL